MRFLHNHLAVVDNHIAEVSSQIHQPGSEGHVVDGTARGEYRVFDFRHIHHRAVAADDVDIGVAVHHNNIILGAIVIDVGNAHVAQVVDLAQRLVLASGLVQAEQMRTRLVIYKLAALDD